MGKTVTTSRAREVCLENVQCVSQKLASMGGSHAEGHGHYGVAQGPSLACAHQCLELEAPHHS